MRSECSRREFIGRSMAALGTVATTCSESRGWALGSTSPNEKLNLAAVGTANRAGANIAGCASENIVALCDVDATFLDKAAGKYPSARKYRDFRVMLEQEADKIDAVLVGTPDHTHAPAAAMAMRLKKHVYCEKPLTHTVFEARTLAQLARENQLVTQMGIQIHAGENYRRVVELIESGTIGKVHEVHVWAAASYGGGRYTIHTRAPQGLDWDLWLGPTAQRPYSEGVHPFYWRWFWDYGTGGLGDLGCHYIDLVHWALKLRHPLTISAQGSELDPDGTPSWETVQYEYPSRGELPAVKLHWYDGGKKPPLLATLRALKGKDGSSLDWTAGQLFVGEHATVISDYSRHEIVIDGKIADVKRPEPYIPSSIGHHREWIEAIKHRATTSCNFDYSGALTESVLLGLVALRAGKTIEWDFERLAVTNAREAQQLLHKEYRQGWEL